MLEPGATAFDEQSRSTAEPFMRLLEPRRVPLQRPAGPTGERGAVAVELLAQLGDIGHDEPCGGCRRGGTDVGGEVAKRRVLLVADRGDDRDRAGRDRPDEPLVAERQQILEA